MMLNLIYSKVNIEGSTGVLSASVPKNKIRIVILNILVIQKSKQHHLNIFLSAFFTARKGSLGLGNIFRSMCQEFCPQWGWVSQHALQVTWPAVYKQLHCWWVSVGEQAAYR